MHTKLLLILGLMLLNPRASAQLVGEDLGISEKGERLGSRLPNGMRVRENLGFGNYPDTIQALCLMAANFSPDEWSVVAWGESRFTRLVDDFSLLDAFPDVCSTLNLRIELLSDPDSGVDPETLMKQLGLRTGQHFATAGEWIRWWDQHWRDYTAPAWPSTAPERLTALRARLERMKAPWPPELTDSDVLKAAEHLRTSLGSILKLRSPKIIGPFDSGACGELEAALRPYHDGDSARAEQLLTSYLATHPRDINARVCRAFARTDQRKARESLEDLDAARSLFAETWVQARLRRLNEHLIASPSASLQEAHEALLAREANDRSMRDAIYASNAFFDGGRQGFDLFGPGDDTLALLALSCQDRPRLELGLILLMDGWQTALVEFTQRNPELSEGWLAQLIGWTFGDRERRMQALGHLRQAHPEDTFYRLLWVAYADLDRFLRGEEAGKRITLTEESRALLREALPERMRLVESMDELLELRRAAAEEFGLRGTHAHTKIHRPFYPHTAFFGLIQPMDDETIKRSLRGEPARVEAAAEKDEKKRVEHDPDDLRLVATTYHAAARRLAFLEGQRWIRIPVAATVDACSQWADKRLSQEHDENPPAKRLELRKQLHDGLKEFVATPSILDPLPLPALSRELDPE